MIDYESLYDNFVKGRMVPFYTVMYPGLLTFASRLLGPSLSFMAEDCVQDAVMTTYEHANEIEDAFHWRWYLMRCIRYKASNLVRHKGVADGYAQAIEGMIRMRMQGWSATYPTRSYARRRSTGFLRPSIVCRLSIARFSN